MNGARIKISRNLLAEVMGYEHGIVHHVREPEGYINPNEIDIYIEHPDLPEVPDGERCTEVNPMFEVRYYKNGRYSFKRLD